MIPWWGNCLETLLENCWQCEKKLERNTCEKEDHLHTLETNAVLAINQSDNKSNRVKRRTKQLEVSHNISQGNGSYQKQRR